MLTRQQRKIQIQRIKTRGDDITEAMSLFRNQLTLFEKHFFFTVLAILLDKQDMFDKYTETDFFRIGNKLVCHVEFLTNATETIKRQLTHFIKRKTFCPAHHHIIPRYKYVAKIDYIPDLGIVFKSRPLYY